MNAAPHGESLLSHGVADPGSTEQSPVNSWKLFLRRIATISHRINIDVTGVCHGWRNSVALLRSGKRFQTKGSIRIQDHPSLGRERNCLSGADCRQSMISLSS